MALLIYNIITKTILLYLFSVSQCLCGNNNQGEKHAEN